MYEKPTANASEEQGKNAYLGPSVQLWQVLARAIRQEKEIKVILTEKEEE